MLNAERAQGMPMIVIAIRTQARSQPAAIQRPPVRIQRMFRIRLSSDKRNVPPVRSVGGPCVGTYGIARLRAKPAANGVDSESAGQTVTKPPRARATRVPTAAPRPPKPGESHARQNFTRPG